MKKIIITTFIIFIILISFYLGFIFKENIYKEETEFKHPIDIEEEKCISISSVYNYPVCSKIAEKAWDNEIKNNLYLLKKVMSDDEYKYINEMNKVWEKSVHNQIDIINRFISNKDGIIYQTEGNNDITNLKKQYALFLNNIYVNYYKDNNEINN